MHLQPTPPSNGNDLEAAIGRLIVEIVRGESLVLKRSILLTLADNLPGPSDRRQELEEGTAAYLGRLYNLAHDHGIDALRDLSPVDLRLVWLALGPADRKEAAS